MYYMSLALQNEMSYVYTVGIDSSDTWVLCDLKSNSSDLRYVHITNADDEILGNPQNIYEFSDSFHTTSSKINCFSIRRSNTILSADLYIQG